MTPLRFSVVVPLFNKAAYIRRCLDSLVAQSHPHFEVLVVNDGSTDEGPQIVREFADERIRLIDQENQGVSAARNKGIRIAKEDWVAFLDADDEYAPDFLATVAEQVHGHPEADLVYGAAYFTHDASATLPQAPLCPPVPVEDYFRFVVSGEGPEVNTSCVAVRRTALNRSGEFPVGVPIGEDSDLWFRLGCVARFVHVPRLLAIYHREASESHWQEHAMNEAYWTRTYRAWRAEGRIPHRLLRSADAYYQRYLLEKSLYRAVQGSRWAAWKALRPVDFVAAPKSYALKVLLHVLLPIATLRKAWTGK